ncbi:unnamed protein product [Brassicogethes aeneus]|uniref:Uncharacterized protein n=1 Tax=Brassicogethes aeneus TaxID=1431903 RepID=A0A9P0FA53_BRAAE|nr:unnamed protein product [Brassicogethes aeneus]
MSERRRSSIKNDNIKGKLQKESSKGKIQKSSKVRSNEDVNKTKGEKRKSKDDSDNETKGESSCTWEDNFCLKGVPEAVLDKFFSHFCNNHQKAICMLKGIKEETTKNKETNEVFYQYEKCSDAYTMIQFLTFMYSENAQFKALIDAFNENAKKEPPSTDDKASGSSQKSKECVNNTPILTDGRSLGCDNPTCGTIEPPKNPQQVICENRKCDKNRTLPKKCCTYESDSFESLQDTELKSKAPQPVDKYFDCFTEAFCCKSMCYPCRFNVNDEKIKEYVKEFLESIKDAPPECEKSAEDLKNPLTVEKKPADSSDTPESPEDTPPPPEDTTESPEDTTESPEDTPESPEDTPEDTPASAEDTPTEVTPAPPAEAPAPPVKTPAVAKTTCKCAAFRQFFVEKKKKEDWDVKVEEAIACCPCQQCPEKNYEDDGGEPKAPKSCPETCAPCEEECEEEDEDEKLTPNEEFKRTCAALMDAIETCKDSSTDPKDKGCIPCCTKYSFKDKDLDDLDKCT